MHDLLWDSLVPGRSPACQGGGRGQQSKAGGPLPPRWVSTASQTSSAPNFTFQFSLRPWSASHVAEKLG